MTWSVWRIAAHTKTYSADDLSGTGAKMTGGRWNEEGLAVIYASTTRALACLETLVHLSSGGLPLNRYLVEITIPKPVWAKAVKLKPEEMPVGWDAEPASLTTIRLGSEWLRGQKQALMFVPSVIVPDEFNVLINPLHPDAAPIGSTLIRKWLFDPRTRKA